MDFTAVKREEKTSKPTEAAPYKNGAIQDEWTGKKTCVRLCVPMFYTEVVASPLNPKEGVQQMKVQSGAIPCVGARCSRWNPALLECSDHSDSRNLNALRSSLSDLSDRLHTLTDLLRIAGSDH